jgi:hypothetical protein
MSLLDGWLPKPGETSAKSSGSFGMEHYLLPIHFNPVYSAFFGAIILSYGTKRSFSFVVPT